jgi:hypothetical protein
MILAQVGERLYLTLIAIAVLSGGFASSLSLLGRRIKLLLVPPVLAVAATTTSALIWSAPFDTSRRIAPHVELGTRSPRAPVRGELRGWPAAWLRITQTIDFSAGRQILGAPHVEIDGSALSLTFRSWCVVGYLFSLVALIRTEMIRRARAEAGRCPKCGYDLSGNTSERCPKCGQSARKARCSFNGRSALGQSGGRS